MIQFKRIAIVVAAVLAAATIIFIYYNFDPSQSALFPRCPSKLISGFDCPGCGSQRAMHSLLNGDFTGMFRYNALLLPALLMICCIASAELLREHCPQFHRAVTGNVAVYSVLAVVLLWTVVRNLPIFKAWLYCQ